MRGGRESVTGSSNNVIASKRKQTGTQHRTHALRSQEQGLQMAGGRPSLRCWGPRAYCAVGAGGTAGPGVGSGCCMGTSEVLMTCLELRPRDRGFLLTEACSLLYTVSACGGEWGGGGACGLSLTDWEAGCCTTLGPAQRTAWHWVCQLPRAA